RRVDARAGLELPQEVAGVLVEREELAGELAGEHQAAACDQHAGRGRNLLERNLPFALAGERVDRDEVADYVIRLDVGLSRDHPRRLLADHLLLRWRELLDARNIPGRRIDHALGWIECDRHRVGATRRQDLHLLAGEEVLVDAGELWPSGVEIDAGGPVD